MLHWSELCTTPNINTQLSMNDWHQDVSEHRTPRYPGPPRIPQLVLQSKAIQTRRWKPKLGSIDTQRRVRKENMKRSQINEDKKINAWQKGWRLLWYIHFANLIHRCHPTSPSSTLSSPMTEFTSHCPIKAQNCTPWSDSSRKWKYQILTHVSCVF